MDTLPMYQPVDFGWKKQPTLGDIMSQTATRQNTEANTEAAQQQNVQRPIQFQQQNEQYEQQKQRQADVRALYSNPIMDNQGNMDTNAMYQKLSSIDPEQGQKFLTLQDTKAFMEQRAQMYEQTAKERAQKMLIDNQNQILATHSNNAGTASQLMNQALGAAGTYVTGFNPNGTSNHTTDPAKLGYKDVKYYPKLGTPEEKADTRAHVVALIEASKAGGLDSIMQLDPIEKFDQDPQAYMQDLYNGEKTFHTLYTQNPTAIKNQEDQARISGNMPSGKPTEEKRHNVAMENKPPANISQIFTTPADVQSYVDLVKSGQVAPDLHDLSARGAEGAKAKLEVQKTLDAQGFNIEQEKTAYKYWNDPTNIKIRQVMDVVSEQLPKLKEASDAMKRMGIPALDQKAIEAKRASGDVQAAKYIASLTTTVEDVAKGIAGGNSITQDQQALAQELLYKGATPEQIDALAQSIQEGVDSRKMTMYKRGGIQAKKYAEQDPWITEETRQKILSGEYGTSKEGKTETTKQTPTDQKAISWAQKFKNDPDPRKAQQAKQILQLHGMQ